MVIVCSVEVLVVEVEVVVVVVDVLLVVVVVVVLEAVMVLVLDTVKTNVCPGTLSINVNWLVSVVVVNV